MISGKKTLKRYGCWGMAFLAVTGCASAPKGRRATAPSAAVSPRAESPQEVEAAVESVLEAVSGEEVSQDDLRDLSRQVGRDPEARSAVEAITNTFTGEARVIKYCPVDGQRYGPQFNICPIHGVPLREITE